MKSFVGAFVVVSLSTFSLSQAGDCSKFFDQSCLATRYDRTQVENDLATKEARAAAEQKAQEEKAQREAERAREEEREYRAEQRRDFEGRVRAYNDGAPARAQEYKNRVEAIKEKYQDPAPSFLDRRPLRSR